MTYNLSAMYDEVMNSLYYDNMNSIIVVMSKVLSIKTLHNKVTHETYHA